MLFGSPGESREFGGFVGGYALIRVVDGNLGLIEAGSSLDLVTRANQGELDHPEGYPEPYLATDPVTFPQNLTATPNIDVIARGVRDIFPELAGAPIDGVIYADPFALAAFTEFTGPITVAGVATPLGPDNLTDFIFDGQYRQFTSRENRFEAIANLAAATAAGFENADLPGPERLGEVLGPVARAGRLQIATFDERENEFLGAVQLHRNFVAPSPAAVDSFAVVQTNASPSKLDIYLHREVDYSVNVDDEGALRAVAEIQLRSEVPDDAAPLTFGFTDGTNKVLLSFYSPHKLTSITVDGQSHNYEVFEEFGFFRYSLFAVELPKNSQSEVRITLEGQAPDDSYRLAVWHQPLVNRDVVRVTYQAGGKKAVTVAHELTENWLFAPSPGSK